MSASIVDPHALASRTSEAAQPSAKIVQLPLDESARRRKETLRTNQALRTQLALLSHHYAQDTTRLHSVVHQGKVQLDAARQSIARHRAHSASIEAELFEVRGDIQFVRERLAQERRRAARLAEIARLPWWAFARRRWALSALAADDAS